ncbi:membrane protein [Gordoniibacillus kamchatkensis]|uniref:Membrane protein n=1 Tax=Gordoniibacillus kamchatkensis TaxID=1590651 RepID=A0ABR5ADT8_9BACL|nr:DUF485 domain-containing protein [Paenibacillus sp. VKM B-2647]KIL38755.1 membrane protein [Paenibacillus sp. VKM B-2647]
MQRKAVNYTDIAKSGKFRELLRQKRKFLVPMTVFFFAFYFLLPILTSYTTFLNAPALGPVSWAWLFAFAQFIMTWALCIVYSRRAVKFDALIQEVKREQGLR